MEISAGSTTVPPEMHRVESCDICQTEDEGSEVAQSEFYCAACQIKLCTSHCQVSICCRATQTHLD